MKRAAAAALAALAAVLTAACSPAAPPRPPAATVAAAAVPANPVTILRATGATPDPGETVGSVDVEGDRYATGTYPDGEMISVYTFGDPAEQAADLARNDIPQDGKALIRGHLFDVYVTAVQGQTGYSYAVTPRQVAARVHGAIYDSPAA